VVRRVLPRDEAVAYFKGLGEHYKAEIIASIPAGEDVSLYREGGFEDLCRGPHVPSTGRLKHFKLMKVAGAYWRGDQRNEMLQRIYGTAWAKQGRPAEVPAHARGGREARPPQARPRTRPVPHRRAQRRALVFWHPKGWTVWQEVEQYMRRSTATTATRRSRARRSSTRALWEKTGHWDNYRENMFTTESEKRDYALKPMNCPGHVLIFKQGMRSYRDLPLRYGEFGQCHRNEPSGALHGIMRVRGFTQDDGHIFCTEDRSSTSAWPTRRCCRRSMPTSASPTSSTRWRRGPTSASAPTNSGTRPSTRVMEALRRSAASSSLARRRRLLRPEDRVHAEGRARPPVAVRHDAGRLQHGRAPGRRVRGREQGRRRTR
jgi:threonyl-tRNA synthetase